MNFKFFSQNLPFDSPKIRHKTLTALGNFETIPNDKTAIEILESSEGTL